uniref:Uncharacterized protein n=1 Tax=Opuntia streptacantha TaxID=393608 RepID=A0A7C8YBZ9_OPUST
MASDAAIACDFAIPTGMFDHERFSKHSISNTDSWASPRPDLNAATKWGIHEVVASDRRSLGKLVNITLMVLKTSSTTVAEDQSSLSNAAVRDLISSSDTYS